MILAIDTAQCGAIIGSVKRSNNERQAAMNYGTMSIDELESALFNNHDENAQDELERRMEDGERIARQLVKMGFADDAKKARATIYRVWRIICRYHEGPANI